MLWGVTELLISFSLGDTAYQPRKELALVLELEVAYSAQQHQCLGGYGQQLLPGAHLTIDQAIGSTIPCGHSSCYVGWCHRVHGDLDFHCCVLEYCLLGLKQRLTLFAEGMNSCFPFAATVITTAR